MLFPLTNIPTDASLVNLFRALTEGDIISRENQIYNFSAMLLLESSHHKKSQYIPSPNMCKECKVL